MKTKVLFITFLVIIFSACSTPKKFNPPLMGWNSWNYFGKVEINETIVKGVIDAIVNEGMSDLGYKYVVIDGGWRDTVLSPNGELRSHPTKFPNGIKSLADYAHSKGLKLGLHTCPGTEDCGGDKVGGWKKETIHVKQFEDWGVDFIKLDACFNKEEPWTKENMRTTYSKWYELFKKSKHDIKFSISAWSDIEWQSKISDMARTTSDISCRKYRGANFDTTRQGIMPIADLNNKYADFAKGGYWNDPDCLVTGEQGLNEEEQKVHFALWCIMTAPIILGNDPRNMQEYEKNIVLNKECIAVDQDPSEQGRKIISKDGFEVWKKKMSNGDNAVLIINRSSKSNTDFVLNWNEIGLKSEQKVRDLYTHKDLGIFKGPMPVKLEPHSCLFLLCN